MKMKRFLALFCAALLLLCAGCGNNEGSSVNNIVSGGDSNDGGSNVEATVGIDTDDLFSDRDYRAEYDETECDMIYLDGDSVSCDSAGVTVSGTTITITDEGSYILTGTLNDGMVIVSATNEDKVQIILDDAAINSATSAALYVKQADKVFLTLAEGTENCLANGGSFEAIDENNIDAAVFSKDDLTINGEGSLTVLSPAGHGIVSKDELTITGGTYYITTASHGLTANDCISIATANMTIAAGKDGMQADNDEDTSLGFVFIQDGTYIISAEGDGISASGALLVCGGTFDIITGGGSENAEQHTSSNWGGMGGGFGGGMGGGMGGRPKSGSATTSTTSTTEDSTSIKGLKSTGNMGISGGTFTLDCADDAFHSNADLTVTKGTFTIETGDDGFHADGTLTVSSGTITISESYEGLEGLAVEVSGGNISIIASDDGINAAGGTDSSGMGGFRGGDMFGGGSVSSDSYISISGGTLYISASGDGVDSNGSLSISGGYTVICGPTSGDTSVLDYETTGTISGGTLIGTGATTMYEGISGSGQGVFQVSCSAAAGTKVTLVDGDGNVIVEHTPDLAYQLVVISTPEMRSGESYTITVGTQSGTFEAS